MVVRLADLLADGGDVLVRVGELLSRRVEGRALWQVRQRLPRLEVRKEGHCLKTRKQRKHKAKAISHPRVLRLPAAFLPLVRRRPWGRTGKALS